MTEYPAWVCGECAEEAGGRMPEGHLATFHHGRCGVCEKKAAVTELRDFRYPALERLNAVRAKLQNAAPAGNKPEEVLETEYAY